MGLHDTAFWYVTKTLLFSVANNCVSSTNLQYCSFVAHQTQRGPEPLFLQFPPLSWSLRLITKLQQLIGLFEHKGGGVWEARVNIIYLSFILYFLWWGMLHVFQYISVYRKTGDCRKLEINLLLYSSSNTIACSCCCIWAFFPLGKVTFVNFLGWKYANNYFQRNKWKKLSSEHFNIFVQW